MKLAKKHLCLALALIFAVVLMAPVYASSDLLSDTCAVIFESDNPYSIALYSTEEPAAAYDYRGYQLLSLNVSLSCAHTSDDEHDSTCYNYAYGFDTLGSGGTSKYKSILMTAAGLTGTYESDTAALNALVDELGKMSDDDARDFADEVYRAIKVAGLAADAETTYPSLDVAQGYWLFADVSTFTDGETNTVKSLVLLDTAGNPSVSVVPKKEVPRVDKKVSDNASDVSLDHADTSIGSTVYFKITGTLPGYLDSYLTYKYVFHDTLSDGLTLNEDSIKVTIDETEVDPDIKTISGNSISVGFSDILSLSSVSVSSSSVIVLTYSTELNEDAVIGGAGNQNRVNLEYSNNPYDESEAGTTPDDVVVVYSFELDIAKRDGKNTDKPLEGAKFKLKNSSGKWLTTDENGKVSGWVDSEEAASELVSDENGKLSVIGLAAGTYYLKETVAPLGYNLPSEPITILIAAEYDTTRDPHTLSSLSASVNGDDPEDGSTESGTVEVTVLNNTGAELPETGGIGTTLFYIIGSVLVVGALVVLITRKRMGQKS